MEVKILSISEIYQEVSTTIVSLINKKPKAILGLATGGTAIGVYEQLVKAYKDKKVSFKNVKSFNLDEYYPIEQSNPQSYRSYMNHNFFDHVDINKINTFFPSIDNFEKYDQVIGVEGGIDFQILGIGSNGHIAFNEPGTSFNSLTHIVKLADSTIKDNARFFNNQIKLVPTQAISMGLRTIMNARQIVLIATGKNKAKVIKQLIEQEASVDLPASILKTHPNVTIYLDEDAASLLC